MSVPIQVIQLLKEGLGGHIKANAFGYRTAIDKEVSRIARIRELQRRTVGLVGLSQLLRVPAWEVVRGGSRVGVLRDAAPLHLHRVPWD